MENQDFIRGLLSDEVRALLQDFVQHAQEEQAQMSEGFREVLQHAKQLLAEDDIARQRALLQEGKQ